MKIFPANSKSYHIIVLQMASTCAHCDVSLMGKRYVLRKEMPTCLGCYENKFANKCEKCKTAITTEHKVCLMFNVGMGESHLV